MTTDNFSPAGSRAPKRYNLTTVLLTTVLCFLLVISFSFVASAQAGVTAVLHDGDARSFADPPDVTAYANTQYAAPPSQFVITTGGSIWRLNEWIALRSIDHWVEAQTTVATTSVGIQFWGDTNDGWARVLVDGSEVWTGDTYGIDANWPGGAFVKYLDISGLTSSVHTVRVESLYGEDVTIYFFGIGATSGTSPTPTPTLTPTPTTTPAPTSTPVPGAGLVAFYSFDGDTNDHSGNGNHATNYGASFVSGVSGQAVSLDGTSDYVSVPININPDVMPQMTVAAWVQANVATGTVMSHDNGGYDRSIDIDYRGGGTGWSAFSGSGGVLGYHPVTVGEWVFIAAVYDQDAGTVRLHVNDATYEEAGSLSSGLDYFNIGSNPSFGANFPGLVDEFRVYNYALSVSEIQSLRQSVSIPTPTPAATPTPAPTPVSGAGPVAYYPFDGDYQDNSGNGNHGVPKNSMSFAAGNTGQGANFDGSSWIEVNDSSSLDLSSAFTFSVWLYKEDAGYGGWAVVFSKGDTSALDDSSPYALAHTQDGRYPLIRLAKNNSYYLINSQTMGDFQYWHMVTVTWNGTTVKFYIDGVLQDSQTWEGTLPNSSSKLLIGSDPPGATEYFRGVMDDLRIYNYALSASEIESVYQAASGPTVTPTPSPTSPVTLTPTPTQVPGPPVTPIPVPGAARLIFESQSATTGSSIEIPLTLRGVSEKIGNIDIALSYNTSVLEATRVARGSLTANSSFDSNIQDGTIRIALFDTQGFNGYGSVASVSFNVIGAEGSTSPLQIVDLAANRASDSAAMDIGTEDGTFTVIEIVGDCNGDGEVTVEDALCILQMAVGKRAVDPEMDVTGDNIVSSADARKVLRIALGMEEL